jgi:hypothetical protein
MVEKAWHIKKYMPPYIDDIPSVVFSLNVFSTRLRENMERKEVKKMKEIELEIEALEERIAPSQPPGLLGFEGQPGNQGGGGGQPPGLLGFEGQPGNQGG